MTDAGSEKLRRLSAEDIAAAAQLSAQAGWNQTEDDWRTLLELSPQGCLAIEVDGHLAATTTLLCYGRRLAWIGMVLTKAEYQRRGFARRLLAHALENGDTMGIATIKLDATDQGEPLYESLGFRSEQEIERWSRPGRNNNCQPATHRWRNRGAIWIRWCSELIVHIFSKDWRGSLPRDQFRNRICLPGPAG